MLKLKVILARFLRGFFAGAVASMAAITINQAASWKEVIDIFNSLALSAVIGGISGGILALDKYLRWEEKEKEA